MITGMPRIAIASADFPGLLHTFGQVLGLPVLDISAEHLPSLGARLAMCVPRGGSNIELMSPAVAGAPLSQSLQRFLDRRGPGLFALMLEAPDPDAEAEQLARRGLKVLPLMPGAAGRDIHPGSAHGVLIRVYPVNSFQGQPPVGAPVGPLSGALSGVTRVMIVVNDLDPALATFGTGLGLATSAPLHDAAQGVARVLVQPPTGGCIELLAVQDARRPLGAALAAHLASRGEGMVALVLQAADPAALLAPLRAAGLQAAPAADDPRVVEIARESAFGALLRIEPAGG